MTTQTQEISVQQNILHLISQIQCEDIRRKREQREINRQNLSVPVTVRCVGTSSEIEAVSRDLSSLGIGLITSDPIEQDSVCELDLKLESGVKSVIGKCQWCRPFGKAFFLTGWKFQTLD